MKIKIITTFFMLACAMVTNLQAQSVKVPFYINGSVLASAQKGDTIFIGGGFTKFANMDSVVQYGTPLDLVTAGYNAAWAKPNGIVSVVIPDGSGGFYLGGEFTKVAGQDRSHIAHINNTGILTQQLAGVTLSDFVYALAFKNNILYVGGAFTLAGDITLPGVTRNRLAAFDITSNTLTAWNPDVNSIVNVLAVKDTTLYAGGIFTSVGGATNRRYFTPLSLSSGAAGVWDPAADNSISAITISGDTIFVGGNYTSFSGQSRSRLAAFTDTTLLSWNPGADKDVRSLAVSGNTVYAAGIFTMVGGFTRNTIAAIDRTSGITTNWDPALTGSGVVTDIAVYNNIVYAGGNFTCTSTQTIGGMQRSRLAALDATVNLNMAIPTWSLDPGSNVQHVCFSDGTLYIGLAGSMLGVKDRSRLAAFSASTGQVFGWNPVSNSTISAMAMSSDMKKVYVTGTSLSTISGMTVTKLAAIDGVTGIPNTSWLPNPNAAPAVILADGAQVFIGGSFTSVNSSTRNRLASVDTITGANTSFNPNIGGIVSAMLLKGDTLYIGGNFPTVGPGNLRNRLGAVRTNGTVLTWNPDVTGSPVNWLALRDSTLYIGGVFTAVGGQSLSRMAAVSTNTGLPMSWNPDPNANMSGMTMTRNGLYISGAFTSVGGQSKTMMAAVDATTGLASSWTPTGLSAAPTYLFSSAANNTVYGGFTATPFFISISGDATLPVTFTSVKAVKAGKQVKVTWTTASEINNHYFEAERSTDGITFEPVSGHIRGAGTSASAHNYTFTDPAPFASGQSTLYYRIRQVDFDGRFDFSSVASVHNDNAHSISETGFAIYPNPGKDVFTIDFYGAAGNKSIRIYDMKGQLMHNASSDNEKENLLLSNYPGGIYFIKVTTTNGTKTSKLIITR